MNGHIQIHRKMIEWEWYSDVNTKSLFLHLLLTANWKKTSWKGITLERGQALFGRKSYAKILGISEQSIRTALDKLKSTSEVTTKSTNKYTVVSIINYELYQQINQQPNQQLTTPKEYKKIRSINNNSETSSPVEKISYEELVSSDLKAPAYEFQDTSLEIIQKLGIPQNKRSSVFKVCKEEKQSVVEAAYRFAIDYPQPKLRPQMFFWKLNEVKKNAT